VIDALEDTAMTLTDVAVRITGEGSMDKYTGSHTRPTRDEIARLAYHFYEARGRWDGQDLNDWLSAEEELTRHYE
jgi:hypothetical protein